MIFFFLPGLAALQGRTFSIRGGKKSKFSLIFFLPHPSGGCDFTLQVMENSDSEFRSPTQQWKFCVCVNTPKTKIGEKTSENHKCVHIQNGLHKEYFVLLLLEFVFWVFFFLLSQKHQQLLGHVIYERLKSKLCIKKRQREMQLEGNNTFQK